MRKSSWALCLSLATSTLLSACGGGDDAAPVSSNGAAPQVASINGIAAIGSPIASAQVLLKCVQGQASATTGSD
ncbi:hypothetical protein, partial [Escherichia coli]